MRWSPSMEEAAVNLSQPEHDGGDRMLVALARINIVANEALALAAPSSVASSHGGAASVHIKGLIESLERVVSDLPPAMALDREFHCFLLA